MYHQKTPKIDLLIKNSIFISFFVIELISYAYFYLSAELGDYNEEEHGKSYLNGIKLLPRQVGSTDTLLVEA